MAKQDDNKEKTIKVHIDPGHYGSKYNNSQVVREYYESNFTWNLSNYLKAELENRGVIVSMSRTSKDANPALYDRGYGAKGCDLFISLHSNACGTESVNRPVVIYPINCSNDVIELANKFGQLIQDLMGVQKYQNYSKAGNNGNYYGVIRGAAAANVKYNYIIEHSFHTNTQATKWLLNDNNVKLLAVKEAELICEYFGVNKKEEVKPVEPEKPVEEVKKYYRVRLSWEDAKSQLGAYTVLENAKKACKEGYTVYDWNGKAVYSNKKKEPKDGDVIKLKPGCTYYNGKSIPSWVFNKTLYFRGRNNNGVIFSTLKTGAITGVVKEENVIY